MSTPFPIVENLNLNGVKFPLIEILLFWSIAPNLTLPSFELTNMYQEFGTSDFNSSNLILELS